MPTITVTGVGNANSTTPGAPWPGGTLPTASDDVVVTGTGAVTNPSGNTLTCRSLALTPTAGTTSFTNNGTVVTGDPATLITALSWTPSAATTTPAYINNGRTSLKGNVVQGNAPYQVGPGVTEFVATTHGQAMTWQVGSASSQANAIVKSSGTIVGGRATFQTSGGAVGSFTAVGFGNARWQIQYGTFTGLGSNLVDGVQFNADASTADTHFDDCLFDDCGRVASAQNIHAAATFAVRRCVWKNSRNTSTCLSFSGAATGITGVHELFDNTFDSGVRSLAGMKHERNIYNTPNLAAPITQTANDFALTWDRNVLVSSLNSSSASLYFGNQTAAAGATNTIWAFTGGAGNPHPLTTGAQANATTHLNRWFFDFGAASWTTTAVGDLIDIFNTATAGATRTHIYRQIVSNGNAAGFGSGHLFRMGSNAVGAGTLAVTIEHCAHYSDGRTGTGVFNAECPMLNIGEPTATIPDGAVVSFKSNLAVSAVASPTAQRGSLIARYGTSNGSIEPVSRAGCTNNGGLNLGTGVGTDGYGYAQATGANALFPSGAPAAVLNADPQLVDITRSLGTWDASLGGPGTLAHAIAELSKRYDPTATWNSAYNIDAALAYLFGGWAPQNAAFNAAHDKVSPTTSALGWIGAVAGASAPSLTAPVLADATSVTATTASVSWSAASGGTAPYTYQVQTSANGGQSWSNAGTSTTSTSKALTALTPGATVSVRVVATDSATTPATAQSNTVPLTLDTALVAGALTLTASTPTSASFTWTAASHGTPSYAYQLQRAPAGTTTWANVSGATTSPATDSTLTAGGAYDFRVLATDGGTPTSATAASNTVSVSTSTRRYPVTAQRFLAGSGATFCPLAQLLAPGQFTPADLAANRGRLMLDFGAGLVEEPCYLAAPVGAGALHPDGSYRVLTFQASPTLTFGTPISGEFRCDEAQVAARPAFTDPTPFFASPSATGPAGERYPAVYNLPGVVVPTSATQLCDSGLFEYTRPASENPTTGPEATWATKLEQFWTTYKDNTAVMRWDGTTAFGYYYERAAMWLTWWARSGGTNLDYLKEGLGQWFRRRTAFDVPNSWLTNEHDTNPRMFVLAFWLLGDTAARDSALRRVAGQSNPKNAALSFSQWTGAGDAASRNGGYARVASVNVSMHVGSHLTGVTADYFGGSFLLSDTLTFLRKVICDDSAGAPTLAAIPAWGLADRPGGRTYGPTMRQRFADVDQTPAGTVLVGVPFQNLGLFARKLRWCYDWLDLSGVSGLKALVLARIKAIADAELGEMLQPANPNPLYTAKTGPAFEFGSIHYNDGNGTSGGPGGWTIDNNLFHIDMLYWIAWRTGDLSYVDKGDQMLDAVVRTPRDGNVGPFVSTLKHATEQFQYAPQIFGLRTLALSAAPEPDPDPSPAPEIRLTPATGVTFTTQIGDAADPAEQTKLAENVGTGTLDGLTATVSYSVGSGWLSAAFDNAGAAPTTLRLNAARGALTAGVYTAQVTVSSTATGVTNSPQTFNVSLVIAEAPDVPGDGVTVGQRAPVLQHMHTVPVRLTPRRRSPFDRKGR